MRNLKIRNVGPLKEVDIELKRINVIIGPQSSGKSCVLKIACHCAWVEKRIQIEQTSRRFKKDGAFLKQLMLFHKMEGYFRDDSYIEYETDTMLFHYNGKTKNFIFHWKNNRWSYKRKKVSYIPAERNIVAILPEHTNVDFGSNNVTNFLWDWKTIRSVIKDFSVLNLGVEYHYNSANKKDEVKVGGNMTLNIADTSSGLQSVIPICGLLEYFFDKQYVGEEKSIVELDAEKIHILRRLYFKYGRELSEIGEDKHYHIKSEYRESIITHRIGGYSLAFKNREDAKECEELYNNYTNVDHSDIYLEEPELNLFPPTQKVLTHWLLDKANANHPNNIFIATHSPYILSSILERQDVDFGLFLSLNHGGAELSIIKTATKEDIQDIYDYDIDAFINNEFFEAE